MRSRRSPNAIAPVVSMRAAGFEDVPAMLALIERAIEHGCSDHYDPTQRRAVFLGYAANMFIDVIGPFITIAAEMGGRLAGVAQLDTENSTLRALYVDQSFQGQGVGRALLAEVESRASAAGCSRLTGAMSLNAVPFYERAGYRPGRGPSRLVTVGVRVPVLRMQKNLR